jgi:hypothetical protein
VFYWEKVGKKVTESLFLFNFTPCGGVFSEVLPRERFSCGGDQFANGKIRETARGGLCAGISW